MNLKLVLFFGGLFFLTSCATKAVTTTEKPQLKPMVRETQVGKEIEEKTIRVGAFEIRMSYVAKAASGSWVPNHTEVFKNSSLLFTIDESIGDPVVTESGKSVQIVFPIDVKGEMYPLVTHVFTSAGLQTTCHKTELKSLIPAKEKKSFKDCDDGRDYDKHYAKFWSFVSNRWLRARLGFPEEVQEIRDLQCVSAEYSESRTEIYREEAYLKAVGCL